MSSVGVKKALLARDLKWSPLFSSTT